MKKEQILALLKEKESTEAPLFLRTRSEIGEFTWQIYGYDEEKNKVITYSGGNKFYIALDSIVEVYWIKEVIRNVEIEK